MGSLLLWILGSVVIGAALAGLSGRFALPLGLLMLGVAATPMAALFIYSAFKDPVGDTSSAGMLSTLFLIFVAPAGISAIFVGMMRKL
jgi:hypothetical protein